MQKDHRPIFLNMVRTLPPTADHPLTELLGKEVFTPPDDNAALKIYLHLTGEKHDFVIGEVEREARRYWDYILDAMKWCDEGIRSFKTNHELQAKARNADSFKGIMAHGGLNFEQAYGVVGGLYSWAAARNNRFGGQLFVEELSLEDTDE